MRVARKAKQGKMVASDPNLRFLRLRVHCKLHGMGMMERQSTVSRGN
jgi:hypothetical protein